MAKQIISLGTTANDKTGDTLRVAFDKVNDNFTEVYTLAEAIPTDVNQLEDTDGLLGGGGNANTGNVVFDGNQLYVGGTGFLNLDNGNDQAIIGTNGPDSLVVSINEGDKEWTFDTEGALIFPDGTVQSTAYTGETTISKFVAINVNGVISGSDDGITWNDYQSNLNSIDRVAVGPNKIVYIADKSADPGESLWYSDAYDTEPTEITTVEGTSFSEVKYFNSISKFIAVGQNSASNPALYYSDNGVDWTISTIDSTYLETFTEYAGGSTFIDIAENELGFFILSDSSYLGGFFLTDITNTLNGDNHIDLSGLTTTPRQVVYTNSYFFSGWHIITGGEGPTDWYYNSSSNPTSGTFDGNWIDVESSMQQEIGISSAIAEFVVGDYGGMSTVMISTNDGQIVYWPAVPAGPFVSVPKPYTSTITQWTSSATSAVTFTNNSGDGSGGSGEKFTVTGSSVSDYNGTFYIGGEGDVYTDSGLTTPFDTTGLAPFTGTATITWSNGQYIDALHYNDGVFYAGNDDEEMFKSIDGGQSWAQVDQLDGTGGETYLNDIDSYISNPGLITFNGVQIRGVASEGKTGLIKLVPSTGIEGYSFLDNGQFVQIYPTNNYDSPHIHIAAGVGAGSEGDIFLGDDNKYVQVNHNGQVSIQSYNTDTNYTYNWSLNTDGSMEFPWIETNIHNGGNQYAQTLKFGNPGQQVIITGPTPAADENAERIIIQGQRGNGTGEGGDVYLWGGDAVTNGGDIKIYAGDADDGSAGYGGYVNLDGGYGYDHGGDVHISGGNSTLSGGSVTLTAGSGTTNGLIYLQTYGQTWTLDSNGALTLPAGGDIKNSAGNSVLTSVIGQQTYEFDGVNTTLTVTSLNFNLLFCKPASGYTGNDGHTVDLPAGVAGQRLVIINSSSLCSLAITGTLDFPMIVNPSTTAELIYSTATGNTGWLAMYGVTLAI